MYYYLTAFIAFASVMILINNTSIANTIIYTSAIVGLMILSKWLFPSQPRKSRQSRPATKTKPASNQTAQQQRPAKNRYTIPEQIHEWPQLNEFDFDIVGEQYYQPAISKIYQSWVSNHKEGDIVDPLDAYLIPDDNNPYDDKAVRVDIDNYTVGHLNRDDARSFRRRLGAKKLTGQITKCKATITGGHELKNGNTASYGVALDLKPFEY